MTVDEAWRLHRQWSAIAGRAAAELKRWRIVNLALLVFASLLGALSAQQGWPKPLPAVLAAGGAAALAVAGIVQTRLLTADRVRRRIGTRAASEALKGLVYQHLAGVGQGAGPDAARQLTAKVAQVQDLAKDYAVLLVDSPPQESHVPEVHGLADYVRERAEGQRTWHQGAARRHKRQARRWRAAELAATLVAAVLAAVAAALPAPGLSAWVAVATTAGTAFAAHLAGEQHERIADGYARTVLDLDAVLRDVDPATATPAEAAAFVADVETVLAAQNDSWVSLFSVS